MEQLLRLFGDIIVGGLAFLGAYLGTKSLKEHLIDDYIESRVTKSQNVNDKVLSMARDMLSSFEQTYDENRLIDEKDLTHLISQCRKLSRLSEDGGKEVSTTCYYLYETIKELEPEYKDEEENTYERLTIGEVVNLISDVLRLIIYYCTNSAPIPFKTKLKKKTTIRFNLRPFLDEKKFYSLKHQPFGLTFNANSEVALRYADTISKTSSYIYARNYYMLLQNNLPVLYRLIANKIYAPLVLKDETINPFLGSSKLHLIKFRKIKSYGSKPGEFYEFYYSNLSPLKRFVQNYNSENFQERFKDEYLDEDWTFNDDYRFQKKLNETIKLKVNLENAKNNYKQAKWKIRWNMLKQRFWK